MTEQRDPLKSTYSCWKENIEDETWHSRATLFHFISFLHLHTLLPSSPTRLKGWCSVNSEQCSPSNQKLKSYLRRPNWYLLPGRRVCYCKACPQLAHRREYCSSPGDIPCPQDKLVQRILPRSGSGLDSGTGRFPTHMSYWLDTQSSTDSWNASKYLSTVHPSPVIKVTIVWWKGIPLLSGSFLDVPVVAQFQVFPVPGPHFR